MKTILTKFDFFGDPYHFKVNNNDKYYNYYGGILFIIYLIIAVITFLLLSLDDLRKKNPVSTTSKIPFNGYSRISLDSAKFYIPFRFINYDSLLIEDIEDYLYINIEYKKAELNKTTGEMPYKATKIKYVKCSETNLLKDVKTFSEYVSFDLNKFYCIDTKDLYLGGDWSYEYIYFYSISLNLCPNFYDEYDENICKSKQKLIDRIGKNDAWGIQILLPNVQYEPYNYEKPLSILYEQYFYYFQLDIYKLDRLYLTENILEYSNSLFVKSAKNISYLGYDDFTTVYYKLSNDTIYIDAHYNNLYTFVFYKTSKLIYNTREYDSIYYIISKNLPILSCIYNIFYSVIILLKDIYLDKKYIEEIYHNKDLNYQFKKFVTLNSKEIKFSNTSNKKLSYNIKDNQTKSNNNPNDNSKLSKSNAVFNNYINNLNNENTNNNINYNNNNNNKIIKKLKILPHNNDETIDSFNYPFYVYLIKRFFGNVFLNDKKHDIYKKIYFFSYKLLDISNYIKNLKYIFIIKEQLNDNSMEND